MVKVKNKTYQPLPLVIDGRTVIIPKRKYIEVEKVTKQISALKAEGLVQVIKI